jgi:hypothetical protein
MQPISTQTRTHHNAPAKLKLAIVHYLGLCRRRRRGLRHDHVVTRGDNSSGLGSRSSGASGCVKTITQRTRHTHTHTHTHIHTTSSHDHSTHNALEPEPASLNIMRSHPSACNSTHVTPRRQDTRIQHITVLHIRTHSITPALLHSHS